MFRSGTCFLSRRKLACVNGVGACPERRNLPFAFPSSQDMVRTFTQRARRGVEDNVRAQTNDYLPFENYVVKFLLYFPLQTFGEQSISPFSSIIAKRGVERGFAAYQHNLLLGSRDCGIQQISLQHDAMTV